MSGKFAEISAVVQSDSPSLDSSSSLSPSDPLDSAPLSSRAFISFNFLVASVITRRWTFLTALVPLKLRIPLCRIYSFPPTLSKTPRYDVYRHSHTASIFSAGYSFQHWTTAASRSRRLPLATRLTSDCRLRKKARSSTFKSGLCAGWTRTWILKPFIAPWDRNNCVLTRSVCGRAPSCW